MVFGYGERVVIDFSLDCLDQGKEPMFGFITSITEDENLNPGTLVRKTCYKAIGDDGEEYVMIDMVYGPPLMHSFMNKAYVLQLIYERNQDLQREVDLLQEYQQLYVEAVTRRLRRGQSAEDLKKRFNKFARDVLNTAQKDMAVVEYYNDLEKTAAAFKNGYYDTGDMAWRDEDGYYWFTGRSDDVIKCSGYRIGTFEVESVLMQHPAVVECAVTAAPDPVRGQVVKATIILAKDYKPGNDDLKKDIQLFVKKTTAPYKYPRIIDFVDELPKTISGKIKRKDIK